MADAVLEHSFERAEDFLAALRPSDHRWSADPRYWVYRGHADSRWLLLPSQNRRLALASYFGPKYRAEGDGHPLYNRLYCQPDPADLGALMEKFVYALDRAGHVVPGTSRFTIERIAEKVRAGQPDGDAHEVVALAQHHELPTYMLDWTRHSNFAAYFAASETAKLPGDLTGKIEVWALNTIVGEMSRPTAQIGGNPVRLWFSMPPRGGNPNLHAQSGLFTYPSFLPGKDGPMYPADEIVRAMTQASGFAGTVIHRLTLPQSEAGQVLHLLSYEPVTGASLFPGVGGVVRDVRDQQHLPGDIRDRARLGPKV
jgi:FRG domain